MSKSERTAFITVTALLAVLALVIILRAVLPGGEKIYRISVITDDAQGDYTQSIRKGLDRAARDYNVDLQILALHSDLSGAQLADLIQREAESGADSIILNFMRFPDRSPGLDITGAAVPLIALGFAWDAPAPARSVCSDDIAKGRLLAGELLKDGASECHIRISVDNSRVKMRVQGFTQTMEEAGASCHIESDSSSAAWADIPGGAFVAALDQPSAEKLARSASAGDVSLYGIGCSNELLYYTEAGVISSLIVEDGYAMGYLAVQSALESIEGRSLAHEQTVQSFVVDAVHLYEEPLQHVLFPVS